MKKIISTGSSVDIIFLFILRHVKFDKGIIEKVTLNLVRFIREPSTAIGRVVMHVSITMMVVDT